MRPQQPPISVAIGVVTFFLSNIRQMNELGQQFLQLLVYLVFLFGRIATATRHRVSRIRDLFLARARALVPATDSANIDPDVAVEDSRRLLQGLMELDDIWSHPDTHLIAMNQQLFELDELERNLNRDALDLDFPAPSVHLGSVFDNCQLCGHNELQPTRDGRTLQIFTSRGPCIYYSACFSFIFSLLLLYFILNMFFFVFGLYFFYVQSSATSLYSSARIVIVVMYV
jgi:hypothetical protein